ncbi:MAG: aminotransferase class I/II-fold pyridoxal phosphate-dependent enzyme [Acholeplasmataceae bacterium]|jgi:threonine aldolase|nr:aminotransferase class I/II-fold pyridoxal phosphate-dependent enzyme [Acholeplasmataceae bacterium]
MIHFRNDYNDIAHPKIIKHMQQCMDETHLGYGMDEHSKKARERIQELISIPVFIHFMVGGTSTNKIVISHILKPYEAVISAQTGHIEVHETGAIESTGHKIITIPTDDGKLTVELIKKAYTRYTDEHMVKPKLVYLSQATETGYIYQKDELKDIYNLCQSLEMYLFIDGARLGVSLTAEQNRLTIDDHAKYSDVFYIGGTKNGAMLGEALITKHPSIDNYLRYSMKQGGGLLAKGFLIGMQFEALFEDQLFFEIGAKANQMANYLKEKLKVHQIIFNETPTNQQFIKLPNQVIEKLNQKYTFETWEDHGSSKTIRLVTNYRTQKSDIDQLILDIKNK